MPKPTAGAPAKWTGTRGNDTVNVASLDQLTRTSFDGSAGTDTLNLSALASGITLEATLNTSSSSALYPQSAFYGSWWDYVTTISTLPGQIDGTIKNFERIVGTSYNDYLTLGGGSAARVVDGGAGDDAIRVNGSSGTNTSIGGLGSDQLFGGPNAIIVGGTYNGGIAPGDDTRDTFAVGAGTILDFELDVDTLYVDTASPTTAVWTDVTTSYGSAAQLAVSAGNLITLVGVTADQMNARPLGYVLLANGRTVTSGAGDDFIFDTVSTTTVDRYIFPSGSGDDELAGFDLQSDTLVFNDTPTFTEVDHHGQASLLATYDGGASTVLLIGLSLAQQASLQIEVLPPDPFL